jgi:hypothetical protein
MGSVLKAGLAGATGIHVYLTLIQPDTAELYTSLPESPVVSDAEDVNCRSLDLSQEAFLSLTGLQAWG